MGSWNLLTCARAGPYKARVEGAWALAEMDSARLHLPVGAGLPVEGWRWSVGTHGRCRYQSSAGGIQGHKLVQLVKAAVGLQGLPAWH